MRGALLMAALLAAGCGTLGEESDGPRIQPHGGTGAFRLLDVAEAGVTGPAGAVLDLGTSAFGSGMVEEATGDLFYSAGALLPAPPEVPEGFDESEVYWPAFEARRLFRAEARPDLPSFEAGEVVLEAREAWEGDVLREPWALTVAERVLLFYVADGGLGLATGPTTAGPFAGGDAPLIAATEGFVPGRPSAVVGSDGTVLLYFAAGGEIWLARSEDGGEGFEPPEPVALVGDDDGTESEEVAVDRPGAAAVATGAGRRLVRLYFESVRADGRRLLYVAGSEDGVTFERFPRAVTAVDTLRAPAPRLLDERLTLLYARRGRVAEGRQVGTLAAALSPSGARLAPASTR